MPFVVIEGLRACFVAMALCAGIPHPGSTPKIVILKNEPHTSERGVKNAPGFLCWEDQVTGQKWYCAGMTEASTVYVSTHTLQAIPHEFLHVLSRRKHLGRNPEDPHDAAHGGPVWDRCDNRRAECAGLWP